MAKADILLVEDDSDVRLILEHILLTELYRVTTADCVAEARSMLARQSYDLVICDVHLPDGSGLRIADDVDPARCGCLDRLLLLRHHGEEQARL